MRQMLGEFHYVRGDYVTALNHLKPAVEAVEKMASRLQYDDIRHFFVIDKLDSYRRMVHSLLELEKTDDAFVSSLSALALVNRPSVSKRQLRREVPETLVSEIDKLRPSRSFGRLNRRRARQCWTGRIRRRVARRLTGM